MAFQWQTANRADIGYVFSLVLNGARNGHFEPQILSQKSEYRKYLELAINLQTDPRGYRTEVLIGWLDQKKTGAVVLTEAIGTPDVGIEIAMIAIKAEFRGTGLGSLALDSLLHRLLPRASVYARCFPASQKLQQMLSKRGFVEVGHLGLATILRHERVEVLPHVSAPMVIPSTTHIQGMSLSA